MIDIVGFRRHGHNEIDEPMFTQPLMCKVIKKKKNAFALYQQKLLTEGIVDKVPPCMSLREALECCLPLETHRRPQTESRG